MSEEPNLRDQLEAVRDAVTALASKHAQTEIECECVQRQYAIVCEDNERLYAELEKLVTHNKALQRDKDRLLRTLTAVGNQIASGIGEMRAPLRGVPMRDGEQKVVRMPQG